MSAQAPADTPAEERARFELVKLDAKDPAIAALWARYAARWGGDDAFKPEDAGKTWRGVRADGHVIAVMSEQWLGPKYVFLANGFCEPNETGWMALLELAKGWAQLLETGAIDRLGCAVLWKNDRMRTLVEGFFGEPYAVLYDRRWVKPPKNAEG